MFAACLALVEVTAANVGLVSVQPGETASALLNAGQFMRHVWLVGVVMEMVVVVVVGVQWLV
jgi:hypothetical protein